MIVTEEAARGSILKLKKENANIHISYHNAFPKIAVVKEQASIEGVYAHLFEIGYVADGRKQVKSYTYADLICGRLVIHELNLSNQRD